MSQGLRDMLANRRFAIPLIILLAFCLIGLLLIGVVLILRPGAPSEEDSVAEATSTAAPTATDSIPPTSIPPTDTSVPTATPTLVPVGTSVSSVGGDATDTPETAGTEVSSVGTDATATAEAGTPVTSATGETATTEPTATPEVEDEQLAQTGVGWGLILASGVGLALLVVAARRLRMAS